MHVSRIKVQSLFKKTLKSAAVVISLVSLTAVAKADLICPSVQAQDIAWGTDSSHIRMFESNMTMTRNASVRYSQKVQRIKDGILRRIRNESWSQSGYNNALPSGYNLDRVADSIAWASECTGNDFVVLTAIFIQESFACAQRRGGGQDSGCGQLSVRTNASVGVIKNQLRLRGQQSDNNANRNMRDSWRTMILSCFDGRQSRLDDFTNFFSRGLESIKNDLRSGRDVEIDLLAAATYLKFRTALAGGYIVPGTAPGGIAAYNSGGVPNYLAHIRNRMQTISEACYEDTYTQEVEETMCELFPNFSCEFGSPFDEISI